MGRRLEPLVNKTLLRLRPKNIHIFIALLLGLWARVGQANKCTHGNPNPSGCGQTITVGTQELVRKRCCDVYKYYKAHFEHACELCGYCNEDCPCYRNVNCRINRAEEFCGCADIPIGNALEVLLNLDYGDWNTPGDTFKATMKQSHGNTCDVIADRDGQTYTVQWDQVRELIDEPMPRNISQREFDARSRSQSEQPSRSATPSGQSYSDRGRQSPQRSQSGGKCRHGLTSSQRDDMMHDCDKYDADIGLMNRQRERDLSDNLTTDQATARYGGPTETPRYYSRRLADINNAADKFHRRQLAALKAHASTN